LGTNVAKIVEQQRVTGDATSLNLTEGYENLTEMVLTRDHSRSSITSPFDSAVCTSMCGCLCEWCHSYYDVQRRLATTS